MKCWCLPPKALEMAGGNPVSIVHNDLDGLEERMVLSAEKTGDAG